MSEKNIFLSDAQLKSEAERCLYCEEKPCRDACPAGCSPADFMMAVRQMRKSDIKRAAKLILANNPFGGVCGAVCPDWFCMKACSRKTFDNPINIPAVQATIIHKAKRLGCLPTFRAEKSNGKKVAVAGAGPAGFAAAAVLAQKGYKVDIFEKYDKAGGACNLIPCGRLPKGTLESEIDFVKTLGDITINFNRECGDPKEFLKDYDAVITAAGVEAQLKLNIPGEDKGVEGLEYLRKASSYDVNGKGVAVVGGGAVAADCALTALKNGASKVEIFTRKNIGDIKLSEKELEELIKAGVNINGRSRITGIYGDGPSFVRLDGYSKDASGTEQKRPDIGFVVLAIKNLPAIEDKKTEGIFFAGDGAKSGGSVVESVASGKNAALRVDSYISGKPAPVIKDDRKNNRELAGKNMLPVSLETDFFGYKLSSPFLISAAPHSDGYEQVKAAYEAGWPGVIMKTSFDGLPIHIPSEYMVAFNADTYGNSDNVSGHALDRVCGEVRKLVKEFPDRLTGASTGGPVTGNDEHDRKGWQSNTLKLEKAGAKVVEYSLSCPQGGDGTKGDIVSQDPELAAKIIDWVMQVSDPAIPKLFKLTGAVTSIWQVVNAIKKVFDKYPNKKAGITLANSFPSLAFRNRLSGKGRWDEAMVVGMSGEGVAPISYLTLSKAAKLEVQTSGNGGPMNYKEAANFLALGVKTVQFCTVVMKYGYGVIHELESGLSHLMEERGFGSVEELIGCALPQPVTDFMDLTPVKNIPEVNEELCEHCGNCQRCGYLAIKLDGNGVPRIDPAKCVGCSLCVKKCFAGALKMRKRTEEELAVCPEKI